MGNIRCGQWCWFSAGEGTNVLACILLFMNTSGSGALFAADPVWN
jgi:hypothetical protein